MPEASRNLTFELTAAGDVTLTEAGEDDPPVILRSATGSRSIECYTHSNAEIEGDKAKYIVAVRCVLHVEHNCS